MLSVGRCMASSVCDHRTLTATGEPKVGVRRGKVFGRDSVVDGKEFCHLIDNSTTITPINGAIVSKAPSNFKLTSTPPYPYNLLHGVLGFWGDRKSTRLNSSH